MNERAQMIKTGMMLELAKEGKTLQDLESELSKTGATMWSAEALPNLVKSMFNLGGASALGLGMLGGTGLYAAYRANEDSTDQQLKKQREKQQYDEAATNIENRMKHPTVL